jgi:hypothetical protein
MIFACGLFKAGFRFKVSQSGGEPKQNRRHGGTGRRVVLDIQSPARQLLGCET